MKQQKKPRKLRGASTRELLGLQGFTNYGLKTPSGELAFFLVQPTNISVLSAANIEVKIRHLLMVLSTHPTLEIACLDSCECFDDNKHFIQERIREELNPAVGKALQQDLEFLDGIQIEMSTARQFVFLIRLKDKKPEQVFQEINRVEKTVTEQGFEVKRLGKEEIKRLLALYFEASMNGETLPDVDGADNFQLSASSFPRAHTEGRALLRKGRKPSGLDQEGE